MTLIILFTFPTSRASSGPTARTTGRSRSRIPRERATARRIARS
jgi:hypothetical protein